MRLPLTSERIRMYCADPLAKKAIDTMKGSDFPVEQFQPLGSF